MNKYGRITLILFIYFCNLQSQFIGHVDSWIIAVFGFVIGVLGIQFILNGSDK